MTKVFKRDGGMQMSDVNDVDVRVLQDGRMPASDSAKYLGRAVKTLASWRSQGIGPAWTKLGGRIFYFKADLDAVIAAGKSSKKKTGEGQ